jgi:hypothetical protein
MHTVPVKSIQQRLIALRMPNKSKDTILKLIQTFPMILNIKTKITRGHIFHLNKLAGPTGPGAVIFALAYKIAESVCGQEALSMEFLTENAGLMLNIYFEQLESLSPEPFLRGDAIIDLGVTPGPDVGVMLDQLLEAQVSGKVESEAAAVEFIKRKLNGNN